jgi:phosphoglycolate phosphatase
VSDSPATVLIDSVLFDLDGTVFDSFPGIAFSIRAAFAACNLSLSDVNLRALLGPPIRGILAVAGNTSDANTLDALERAFRHSYDTEGWQRTACFPGAEATLRELLRRGHRLFAVTNKPRHVTLRTLDHLGVAGLFEAVVTRDTRSPAFRDKNEMVADLLASHKLVSDNCLMVGDTMEDAVAAAQAGIRFVWMAHGYGTLRDSSAVPVSCVLQHFSELPPLISQGSRT